MSQEWTPIPGLLTIVISWAFLMENEPAIADWLVPIVVTAPAILVTVAYLYSPLPKRNYGKNRGTYWGFTRGDGDGR